MLTDGGDADLSASLCGDFVGVVAVELATAGIATTRREKRS